MQTGGQQRRASTSESHSRHPIAVLPRELFTNEIAVELQNRDKLNVTEALATLDREDNPKHLEIKRIGSLSSSVIGSGSFGIVFQAQVEGTDKVVAVKRVYQDRKYKNRELQVMKLLNHPNCVKMLTYFYTQDSKSQKTFLNMALEYVPQTIYSITHYFAKQRKTMPTFYAKLYTYQLCRSLAYIHGLGICHRDIKPQNLLVDPAKGVVKLADFGSSKVFKPNEPSVSYICSRFYRAPELILGATFYTTSVDLWSLGCVIAEMLLGRPVFPGSSSTDQMIEIIKALGPPTPVQVSAMNADPEMLKQFDFTKTYKRGRAFTDLFHPCVDRLAIDLVSKFLVYAPNQRLTALESLNHPYFADLCDGPGCTMPDGIPMPPLFNFTEVEKSINPHFYEKLLEAHRKAPTPTAKTAQPAPQPAPKTSSTTLPSPSTQTETSNPEPTTGSPMTSTSSDAFGATSAHPGATSFTSSAQQPSSDSPNP